jgi:hypothetical protein
MLGCLKFEFRNFRKARDKHSAVVLAKAGTHEHLFYLATGPTEIDIPRDANTFPQAFIPTSD